MTQQDIRAVDAIWKTDLEHANEKLVLYHLASKHELGDRYSSAWKNLDRFLDEFQPRWSHLKDIKEATQLSDVKLQRTIEALQKRGYIESQPNNEARHQGGLDAFVYGIKPKIFEDYRLSQSRAKKKQA
jgi:DNA-binding MarR family transcriptional regulator